MPTLFCAVLLALGLQAPAAAPRRVVRAASEALERGEAALLQARWDVALERDSSDRGALLGRATLARRLYDYRVADGLYRRLTDVAGPSGGDALYSWLGRADAAASQGQLAVSDSLYQLGRAAAQRLNDATGEAEALLGLATARARTIGPASALALVEAGLRLVPPDEFGVALGLRCRRAMVLATLGRREAEAIARAGIARAGAHGEFGARGLCYHALARFHETGSSEDSSIAALGRAAEDFRRVGDRARLAAILQGRSYQLLSMGEYGAALDDANAAREEATKSNAATVDAWASINIAQTLIPFGDLATAHGHLARADSLLRIQGDRYGLFVLNGVQGWLMESAGDTAGARRAFLRGVADAPRFTPHLTFLNHRRLAALALQRGDTRSARVELDVARRGYRELGMTNWDNYLDYLYGVLALAEGHALESARLLERHGGNLALEQRARRYLSQVRLAEALAALGRVAASESTLDRAIDSLESWRATLTERRLRLHSFELREVDANEGTGAVAVIAALVRAGRTVPAFRLAERHRARDLLDRLIQREALRRHPSRVGDRRTPAIPADAAANGLPDDRTALVTFVAGPGAAPGVVFTLTRAGLTGHVLERGPAAAEIARLRSTVMSGRKLPVPARQLGALLLDSALARLPASITRLVIVPDGLLHRLPFEALLLSDGRALGERYSVGSVPSVAVALELWKRPARQGPAALLVMGNPRFAPDSLWKGEPARVMARAFQDAGGLPPLAGSAREARRVARFGARAEVLLGTDASESRLKRTDVAGFRVLHFATHALADDHTLHRTALALTPDSANDGFLTPGELAELELDADLVVLSACRTAEGVLLGNEGIQGLTAPILEAGARAVIATRWPVGDRRAARLVEDVYDGLARGLDVGAALRDARRAAIARGAPASEWAAFTLIGDPAIRVPLVQPPRRSWVLGLLPAVIAVVVLWRARGRVLGSRRTSAPS